MSGRGLESLQGPEVEDVSPSRGTGTRCAREPPDVCRSGQPRGPPPRSVKTLVPGRDTNCTPRGTGGVSLLYVNSRFPRRVTFGKSIYTALEVGSVGSGRCTSSRCRRSSGQTSSRVLAEYSCTDPGRVGGRVGSLVGSFPPLPVSLLQSSDWGGGVTRVPSVRLGRT